MTTTSFEMCHSFSAHFLSLTDYRFKLGDSLTRLPLIELKFFLRPKNNVLLNNSSITWTSKQE